MEQVKQMGESINFEAVLFEVANDLAFYFLISSENYFLFISLMLGYGLLPMEKSISEATCACV